MADARRGELAVFGGLTLALSLIFYVWIVGGGGLGAGGGLAVVGLMWCPGAAALATTWWSRRSVGGLGWRRGPWRYWLYGYLAPILYAGVVYVLLWSSGVGALDAEVAARLTPAKWLLFLPGSLMSCATALGEEIGWRGFLTPRLHARYGYVRSTLLTGFVWAAWHYPLLLAADYNAGTPWWYGLACFTLLVVGISFLFAWLRLASGSVWPAMLLHGSHNLWIQGFFDRLTADTGPTEWWSGEFGAGLALAALAVAWIAVAAYRRRPHRGWVDDESASRGA